MSEYIYEIRIYDKSLSEHVIWYWSRTWKALIDMYKHKTRGTKKEWPEGVIKIVYSVEIGEERVPLMRLKEGIEVKAKSMTGEELYYNGERFGFRNALFPGLEENDDINEGIIRFNRMQIIYYGKKISKKLQNQHAKLEILNELHERYTGLPMPLEVRRLIVKNMY